LLKKAQKITILGVCGAAAVALADPLGYQRGEALPDLRSA
jgi:hypothetical protein